MVTQIHYNVIYVGCVINLFNAHANTGMLKPLFIVLFACWYVTMTNLFVNITFFLRPLRLVYWFLVPCPLLNIINFYSHYACAILFNAHFAFKNNVSVIYCVLVSIIVADCNSFGL